MSLTTDIRSNIENQFRARAKSQGWKPGSAKYKNAEMEFFVGAMTAHMAITGSDQTDAVWVIRLMSGRGITGDKS
jgi:hypothetical protein